MPHVHVGVASDECTRDDKGGREGRYLNVCWLGFMLTVQVTSIYAERRFMAGITREREAEQAVAARGDQAQSAEPTTTGESR